MRDMEKNFRELPLFRKGEELLDLTRAIVENFDESKDSMMLDRLMLENAMTIPAKIAAAEGGDLYSIRVENAFLIKLSARELVTQIHLCQRMDLVSPDYLDLLHSEIEQFRLMFLGWVCSFDRENDIQDDWHFEY